MHFNLDIQTWGGGGLITGLLVLPCNIDPERWRFLLQILKHKFAPIFKDFSVVPALLNGVKYENVPPQFCS